MTDAIMTDAEITTCTQAYIMAQDQTKIAIKYESDMKASLKDKNANTTNQLEDFAVRQIYIMAQEQTRMAIKHESDMRKELELCLRAAI